MGFVIFLVILLVIALIVVCTGAYVVKQQTYAIIERLGKFNKIVEPGFHVKVPIIDKIAMRVDMRTHQSDFEISGKTKDNVNIVLRIASQYQVNGNDQEGIYKSYYTLSNPIQQMESYIIDALRSAVPKHTLDEVYDKKDDIAILVQETVSKAMVNYGFQVINVLITNIKLPADVEQSMNSINAAQREKAAAQDLAEADKIKMVTEAEAKAESAKLAGTGIAEQRTEIANGISKSLRTITNTGVTTEEANLLFMFTQWTEMMDNFAKNDNTSTVVLPANFKESASMFEQMLCANDAENTKFFAPSNNSE